MKYRQIKSGHRLSVGPWGWCQSDTRCAPLIRHVSEKFSANWFDLIPKYGASRTSVARAERVVVMMVAVCAVFFWHRQVEVCTIILCSGLLHAVRINNTKHVSAVILSAVDDRTMRNHQPLGTYSKGCVHTQSDVLGIMLSHYIDHILELWVTWQTGLPGKCVGFARVLRSV